MRCNLFRSTTSYPGFNAILKSVQNYSILQNSEFCMYVLISSYRGVLFYGDFLPQIIAISVAVPSISATKGSCVQTIQD